MEEHYGNWHLTLINSENDTNYYKKNWEKNERIFRSKSNAIEYAQLFFQKVQKGLKTEKEVKKLFGCTKETLLQQDSFVVGQSYRAKIEIGEFETRQLILKTIQDNFPDSYELIAEEISEEDTDQIAYKFNKSFNHWLSSRKKIIPHDSLIKLQIIQFEKNSY